MIVHPNLVRQHRRRLHTDVLALGADAGDRVVQLRLLSHLAGGF
jgi:hypothetical protein